MSARTARSAGLCAASEPVRPRVNLALRGYHSIFRLVSQWEHVVRCAQDLANSYSRSFGLLDTFACRSGLNNRSGLSGVRAGSCTPPEISPRNTTIHTETRAYKNTDTKTDTERRAHEHANTTTNTNTGRQRQNHDKPREHKLAKTTREIQIREKIKTAASLASGR